MLPLIISYCCSDDDDIALSRHSELAENWWLLAAYTTESAGSTILQRDQTTVKAARSHQPLSEEAELYWHEESASVHFFSLPFVAGLAECFPASRGHLRCRVSLRSELSDESPCDQKSMGHGLLSM